MRNWERVGCIGMDNWKCMNALGASVLRAVACALVGLVLVGCSTGTNERIPRGLMRTLQNRSVDADRLGIASRGSEVDVQVYHHHGSQSTIIVPMKWLHGLPAMEVSINKQPVTLIVDTGSEGCLVLDADTAVRTHVDVMKHAPDRFRLEGSFGSEPALLGRVRVLEMGAWSMRGLPALIRTHQSRSGGQFRRSQVPLNVWGMALPLKCCRYLVLDYPGRVIEFGFEGAYQPRRGNRVWREPMRIQRGVPRVEVETGGVRWSALLDTGANATLELTRDVAARAGLLDSAQEVKGQRFGMGVSQQAEHARVLKVQVPRLRGLGPDATQVPAYVVGDEGKVGTGLLSRYRVTLDFERKVLWLEMPANSR